MKRFKKAVKIGLITLSAVAAAGVISLAVVLEPNVRIAGWARLDENKLTDAAGTLVVLCDDGKSLGPFYEGNRIFTPISGVAPCVIDAFVSAEDKNFYKHRGFDLWRIAAAVKNNILSASFKEGASTITQQLVKNTHLTGEKRLSRKLQEIRIARELERKYGKDEILEMYLNILYFGGNVYGIGSAARVMFGASPADLTPPQAALLAAIINNPTRYNPYSKPENALRRRNLVLGRMLENGKLSKDEHDAAVNEPLKVVKNADLNFSYISDAVSEAADVLKCGRAELFNKNLTIETYLDPELQELAADAFAAVDAGGAVAQIAVINNLTGRVRALYGNSEFYAPSDTKRQPGSTLKPVLCYAPALERRLVVPVTPIADKKTDFDGYAPSNYNGKYAGWTTVQGSLAESSNVCAVKLLQMNGIENAKRYAAACGIAFSPRDGSLALALGSLSDGVTLRRVAGTFQTFANDGVYIPNRVVKYIKNADGAYVYNAEPAKKRVFSSETAFFINEMLSECAKSGTAKRLRNVRGVCAKTGTVGDADGNTDAYCLAYNADYTVAVWLGTADYSGRIDVTGGGAPTEIAAKILGGLQKRSRSVFNKPNTIISVELDGDEFNLNHRLVAASENVPKKSRKAAYFTRETAPQNFSAAPNPFGNDSNGIDFDNFEVI
ncbi:MAG: penicillin-binding protein [Clostridiales bacterium]|jgi:membrane peptidoglycan carboxypeptidase|nr:penicillin-binding protein [Clostridiales bacterium]